MDNPALESEPRKPNQPPRREFVQSIGLDLHGKSIASDLHPERNEDAIFQLPEQGAFGVFDGMGGHAAGDVASRIARDTVGRVMSRSQEGISPQQTVDAVNTALVLANQVIIQEQRDKPAMADMGATASVVKLWQSPQGERKAVIGNVGDSRVYVLRANGVLEQITLDDGVIRKMVRDEAQARVIQTKMNNNVDPQDLSDDEYTYHDHRNVLSQALGGRIEPRLHVVDIQTRDRVIVTSDGIHDNLTDIEITRIVSQSPNSQVAVEQLTEAARIRSRDTGHQRQKPDDMSAVVAGFSNSGRAANVQIDSQPPIEIPSQQPARFVVGDVVRVQRTSGVVENDWYIIGYNQKTGDVIVQKNEGNQALRKELPQAELRRLNQLQPLGGISSANTFGELFATLDTMGTIHGSNAMWDAPKLKQLINRVRSGEIPLDRITRANGLRAQVERLLAR